MPTRSTAGRLLAAATTLLTTGALTVTALAGTTAPAAAAGKAPQLGVAAGGTMQFLPAAQRNAWLDGVKSLGATWIRFDFDWTDIQRSNASSYDFARYDDVVAAAAARGLQVVGMLGYPPAWARSSACSGSQYCQPSSAALYGTFAGATAAHFKGRVKYWEMWNEPNLKQYFQPAPNPAFYTAMLKSAASAVHAADSSAQVMTGGTGPAATINGEYSPQDFLAAMYANGAQGSFDVLGHHPYCFAGTFDCPATQATWSAWSEMQWTSTSLRSLMTAHGDGGKQIWGTEFGTPTNGSNSVSEAQQANDLANAVKLFGQFSWSGPLFLYSLQDFGTDTKNAYDWFGVERADGSHKPSFAAVQSVMQQAAGSSGSSGSQATAPSTTPATTAPAPAPSTPAATTPPPVASAPATATSTAAPQPTAASA